VVRWEGIWRPNGPAGPAPERPPSPAAPLPSPETISVDRPGSDARRTARLDCSADRRITAAGILLVGIGASLALAGGALVRARPAASPANR
jgi:hypothetical protein